jgi:hypothetical protein
MLELDLKDNFAAVKDVAVNVPAIIFKGITKEADMASNILRNKIILAMRNTPRTGKKYSKEGGRIHIASKKGNAPAPDTGNLLAHIVKDAQKGKDKAFFTVGVSSGVPYATKLEDPKKLDRPIIRKVLAEEWPKIKNDFAKILIKRSTTQVAERPK